ILVAERFNASDVPVARRNEFLDDTCAVETELQLIVACRRFDLLLRIEAHDSYAAATDVGFDHNGKAHSARRIRRLARMGDDERARIGKAERFGGQKLQSLRVLAAEFF